MRSGGREYKSEITFEKSSQGLSRSPEGMNILFEPSPNRRRKGILNLLDRCHFPVVCNLQARDCAPRGLLAEDGKAIKIRRSLIADSENGY
jgi:hypothetical protein